MQPDFKTVKENAIRLLIQDGHHSQIIIIFTEHNPIFPIPLVYGNEEEKKAILAKLKQVLDELHATHYIHIVEGTARKFKTLEEVEYVKKNQDTEHPDLYPDHLKQHILIVREVHKDGTGMMAYIEFKNTDDKIEIIRDDEITLPVLEDNLNFFNFFK